MDHYKPREMLRKIGTGYKGGWENVNSDLKNVKATVKKK